MQDNLNVAYFRSIQLPIINKLKSRLRIGNAVNPALKARKTLLFAGFVLNSTKEVLKGFMNSIRNILQDLRVDIFKLSFENMIIVKLVKRYLSKLIDVFGYYKKFVISFLTHLKLFKEPYLLFFRRIQAIFEHLSFVKNHDDVRYALVYIPYAHVCPVSSGVANPLNLMDIEAITPKSHWTFGLSSGRLYLIRKTGVRSFNSSP